AADEGDVAVDDERLPVGPIVDFLDLEARDRIDPADLYACGLQPVQVVAGHVLGPERIEHQAHDDPAASGGDERIGKACANLTLLVDIRLEADSRARAIDRRDHGGEGVV